MNQTETTISYGRKVQAKQFEPVEVRASTVVSLDEGETQEDAVAEYYPALVDTVNEQIVRQLVTAQHVTDINVDELAERLKIPAEDVREAVLAVKGEL